MNSTFPGKGHAAVSQPSTAETGQQPGRFEPLLNDEQTAQLLGGMHTKTLQRMARNGQIPAHKIGRYWYFRASELDSWLKTSCVPADDALNSGHRPCLVN
jgi:excisionase family DNA binding protein